MQLLGIQNFIIMQSQLKQLKIEKASLKEITF